MRNGSITLLLSLPRPGLEFGGLQGSELGRRRPPSGAGLCSRAPRARGVRIAAPHKGPPPSRAWGGAQAEGAQPPAPHLGAGAPALRCSLLASPTRRLATVFRSLCSTLCDPMDCSPPGSSAHGILQARILEWVAIPFSRGSSQPRDQTQATHIVDRPFTI